MAFLDQNPGLGYPLVAGFGLLLGSFYNVVILRLPKRLEWEWKKDAREALEQPEVYDPPPPGIVIERSHCPHCKHQLSWYENIPVFSYLALRGRCRHCKTPISIQYPAVELLTMLLMLACVARFGFGWQGFGAMVLTSFLIILSGIDLRTQYLPDSLTLPLMWLGIIAASDYVKALPDSIDRWTGGRVTSLGTDGFGRSEGRSALRDFFEVDAKHIVLATLGDLVRDGKIQPSVVHKAIKDLGINPEKPNPAIS